MSAYAVSILPSAEQDLDSVPTGVHLRLQTAILALGDVPRPPGAIKMSGIQNRYRIRVGNYRVVYEIHDKQLVVIVVAVADRGQIYRIVKRR